MPIACLISYLFSLEIPTSLKQYVPAILLSQSSPQKKSVKTSAKQSKPTSRTSRQDRESQPRTASKQDFKTGSKMSEHSEQDERPAHKFSFKPKTGSDMSASWLHMSVSAAVLDFPQCAMKWWNTSSEVQTTFKNEWLCLHGTSLLRSVVIR